MKSKSANLNLPIANPMIITMINCSWIPQLIIIMMIPCRWTFGSTRRLCRPGWLLESPPFSPCPLRSVKSSHVHSGKSQEELILAFANYCFCSDLLHQLCTSPSCLYKGYWCLAGDTFQLHRNWWTNKNWWNWTIRANEDPKWFG